MEAARVSYDFGNPYTLALLGASLVSLGLSAVVGWQRDDPASRSLAVFLVATGVWALGDAVRLAAPTPAAVRRWNQVAYAGVVLVPPSLLSFAAAYTGRRNWLRRRAMAALLAVSAVAYALVLTNPVHSLWLTVESTSPGTAPPVLTEDWGPAWYLWATYVYVVVFVATAMIAREFTAARRSVVHRRQTGIVLFGLLVTWGVNALFVFDLVAFDPTPFAFALLGLTVGLAIYRYQLLSLMPIARDVVVQDMDSGVLVLDDDDRVVDANRALGEIFGVDDVAGLDARAVFADHPAVRRHLGLVDSADRTDGDLDTGGASSDGPRDAAVADGAAQTVAVTVDGETRHYDVSVSVIRDALDAAVGHTAVFSDVTARVERERQLRHQTARLERQNERLDQFASAVSHDLRNPLNVVSGRLELARDADDPGPHLEEAAAAADRMETIVTDVLSLAQAGSTIGEREPVAVEAVARSAWALVESEDATLVVEAATSVLADPDRVQEVFENLFANCLEHAADGDRATPLTVRVGTLEDGFYVADDGPGIPRDERERIFEPGFSTAESGTGFGLSIVAEVVRAHGWSIEVTDSAGGGARFEISGVSRGMGH
ncbi:MAG: histidine kinase N-terminal 7TM domain-containing protein [Halobacteriaceae archaeon]